MHIFYDIEIEDPDYMETVSPKVLIIFDTIRDFLAQRYKVLENEMNAEWDRNLGYVLIVVPRKKGDTFRIGYPSLSKKLTNKLISCLDENDYKYLNKIIGDNLS